MPELVKRMPDVSSDGLSYTFELNNGEKWDDGNAVNADDVIFTIKAAKCNLTQNPITRGDVENIQSVSADTNQPLRFTITEHEASIQNMYSFVNLFILSRNFFDPNHVLDHYEISQLDDSNFHPEDHPDLMAWAKEFNDEKYGNDLTHFFGCGPYKVTDWQRDQTITLERKPNHWTMNVHDDIYLNSFPDKIIFKVIADDNALELAIKSQEVDASTWLSTRALMRLENDSLFKKNYHYAYLNAYTANFIVMNMKPDGMTHKKIFDDANVRRAMAYLTPCDNLMQVMAQGKGMRWSGIMSPLKKECDTTLQLIPLDENKASQLLNEAGWKDTDGDGIRDKVVEGEKIPLQFQLMVDAGVQYQNMGALIQESMAKAGVSVQIQPLDPNLKRQKISMHDFDMAVISFSNNSMPYDYSVEWKIKLFRLR
jgi:peptide/nickel transport system substrate-binding protein